MAQINIFSEVEPSGQQGKLQKLSLGEGNAFRFNFEEEKKEELDRSVVYMHEDLLLSQKQLDNLHNPKKEEESKHQPTGELRSIKAYYAILELERPILCPPNALLIASKLD